MVRRCTLDDLQSLKQISTTTFIQAFARYNTQENMDQYVSTAFTDEKLTRELNNTESEFYFLFASETHASDTPAAYLKINYGNAQSEQIEAGADCLEVERIYVLEEYQKQGYGKILMDVAFQRARELGKSTVWLGVWEHNRPALNFYTTKCGFERCGEHKFVLGDDVQTDYIMKKAVPLR